jgi:hypothetical protein
MTSTYVLFHQPREAAPDWGHTALRDHVDAIPGVTILEDPDGREAARFGAMTSGHAVFYDRQRQLRFAGGITPARGHEGSNHGREAIHHLLQRRTAVNVSAPVFGCDLHRAETACRENEVCPVAMTPSY